MKRLSSRKSFSMKEMLQRIDRIAGDLNILLVVIAIGLATLDLTFLVTQNVVSSLFNSHLFDFHEGWMYVIGVGVAGGIALKASVKPG